MKICPQCSFQNDERFPTCAYCNAVIVDAAPEADIAPSEGEAEQRRVAKARRRLHGRQMLSASLCYAGAIAFTALCPGMVFGPTVLLAYFLGGLLVAALASRGVMGQVSASLLQGLLCVALLFAFCTDAGPFHPLLPFMLLSHIVLPTLYWNWARMINDAHR